MQDHPDVLMDWLWGVKFVPFEVKSFHPSFNLFRHSKNNLIFIVVEYTMLITLISNRQITHEQQIL